MLLRAVVESPCLEGFKRRAHVAPGTWFSGELVSIELTVGFNELKSFFQPKPFDDSIQHRQIRIFVTTKV